LGKRLTVVVICVATCALFGAGAAHAAFPGTNGQIAYSTTSPLQVRTIFPDGTGDRLIAQGGGPAWAPDGNRIAYGKDGQIFVARADGSDAHAVANGLAVPAWSPDGIHLAYLRDGDIFVTDVFAGGETNLTNSTNAERDPAWSPDGTKIAFARDVFSPSTHGDVWVMDADGSNQVNLTDDGFSVDDELEPDWSPDGTRIAYRRGLQGNTDEVYVMNADGTGVTQLTLNSVSDGAPAWSPDGTKIAFSTFTGALFRVFVMNSDGSSPVPVTPSGLSAHVPDWQPVVFPGYARPKAASPTQVALVPTYNFCFAQNRTHGPPLAFASCSPPTQRSITLTVGTPDANGAAANSVGSARFATLAGNPGTPADEADVRITVHVSDVRCVATNAACPGGALSDFAGRILLTPNVQVTDRENGSPGPGTMQFALHSPIDCAPTPDPAVGSTCALSTTMDSIVPGAVPEGSRTIWEIGEVQVWDPGPNGTGYANCPPTCGNGDEAPFMRQGVFVP
jgi:TolB protein